MEFAEIVTVSEYIKGFGVFALPLLFSLIVLQCHIPVLPFGIISAVCGFIFGFKWGMAISWISVVVGSTIAFYLYRRMNLDNLAQKILRKHEHISVSEEFIFGFIIIVHNIPVIPIAVPNIMASLSTISTRMFVVATALGLFIPSLGFAAFGSGIDSFLVSPSYLKLFLIVIVLLILLLLKKYSNKIFELIYNNTGKMKGE